MPDNANDDDTTDDDSSYHPEDELVNDNLQIEGVDYDNEAIITEPKVTH